MRKKTVIFAISFVFLLATACTGDKTFSSDITCEQILNAASAAVGQYQNTTTYIKNKNNLDTHAMSLWADGIFEECAEYDLLSDYAICYSNDNTTYEISVLKADTPENAQELLSVLNRRKQTMADGTKAAYDPDFEILVKNSRIFTDGDFAILLITQDNNAAVDAIQNLKK